MKAALYNVIETVVRREFADAQVHHVDVKEDVDFDGDNIVRIDVIFVSSTCPDSRKMAGLARHLRPLLQDEHLDAFLIVSFRSKADNDWLSAAA